MSGLLILGAGGHSKVVAETALASGVASSVAFLDDRCTGLDPCMPVLGWPVIGPLARRRGHVHAFDSHGSCPLGPARPRAHGPFS